MIVFYRSRDAPDNDLSNHLLITTKTINQKRKERVYENFS